MIAPRAAVLSKIAAIIRGELGDAGLAIDDTTTAQEIPTWDSLAHIGIILAVEKNFGIRLRAAEVASLDCVGTLVDLALAKSQAA